MLTTFAWKHRDKLIDIEEILKNERKELAVVFRNLRLQPSPTKTISRVFRLYIIKAHNDEDLT